ncbi:imm11 family protein [Melittangium boletus]|uniref:imm11 family protein n=1 Tax=Melittangium boletus TaxID=83453 RepID=UPI003DA3B26E
MSYFILQGDDTNGEYCQIWKFPSGMPHIHRPSCGIGFASDYPEGMTFSMAPEVPAIRVADVIPNTFGYLLVSGRLKELLAQHATEPIEFLTFTLLNQRGRVASKDCYIANVLGTRDWADIDKSVGARFTTPEGTRQFNRIRRLYLKDEMVIPTVNMFRIAAMPKLILVREDLKALMEAAGMTGAVFHALGTKVDIE